MTDIADSIDALLTLTSEEKDEQKAKFFEGIKPKVKKEVMMTWGKYKGKRVKDVILFDEKYAKWVHKQEFSKKFNDIYTLLDDHFKHMTPLPSSAPQI